MAEHLFDVVGAGFLPVFDLARLQVDAEDQVVTVMLTWEEVRDVAFVAAHFFTLGVFQSARKAIAHFDMQVKLGHVHLHRLLLVDLLAAVSG